MATWAIGDVTVIRIEEQIGFASRAPEDYLDGFEREVLARPQGFSPEFVVADRN